MEREPGIERDGSGWREHGDDAVGANASRLAAWRGAAETEEDVAREIAEAEADIAAGRVYPHSVVGAWLKTWGTPAYRPFHEWLKSSG